MAEQDGPARGAPGNRRIAYCSRCGAGVRISERVRAAALLCPRCKSPLSLPAGSGGLVRPMQADEYSISVTNVSRTEVRLNVQVRTQ